MHDFVNDLAQFASGEFCCKYEDGKLHEILEKKRVRIYSTSGILNNFSILFSCHLITIKNYLNII